MLGMIVGGFIPSTPQYVNENIPGLPAIADMTNKVRFSLCMLFKRSFWRNFSLRRLWKPIEPETGSGLIK
jgi:hypothetical protein